MYSIAFALNVSSWVASPARAASISAATDVRSGTLPFATRLVAVVQRAVVSRTWSPSFRWVSTSGPTASTSGTPASTRTSGPRFGYRPLIDGDVDHRRHLASTSASALMVQVDVVDAPRSHPA